MSGVTQLLASVQQGEARAADELLALVYDELRKLAAQQLAAEKPGQTLQATALVHEAYLRLVGPNQPPWGGRGHFVAAAAEAMRRILVDRARRRGRIKHGGGRERIDLDQVELSCEPEPDLVLSIHEALDRFALEEPSAAALVKLRVFVGLSVEEAADALGVARSTGYEHWSYARAWLHDAVYGRGAGDAR